MQRPSPDAERPHTLYWRQLGSTVATIFVMAVLGNYPWELAQAPLYVGIGNMRALWWHCLVASLGDGLLVLGIFAAGWVVLRRYTWFMHPGVAGYGVMVAAGLVIGVTVEWVAVYIFARWMYTAWMPHVPGLAVGLVPVLQMLVLPPLIFHLVARWRGRAAQPDNTGLEHMGQPRGGTRQERGHTRGVGLRSRATCPRRAVTGSVRQTTLHVLKKLFQNS